MKVLMIGPIPPSEGGTTFGGVATAVSQLAKNLSSSGDIDLHLFAINSPVKSLASWKRKVKGYYVYYPLEEKKSNLFKFVKLFGFSDLLRIYSTRKLLCKHILYGCTFSFLYIKKIINQIKPDLIHAHHAHELPILAWLACDGDIPIVTTLHSFHALLDLSKHEREQYKRRFRTNFEIAQKLIAVSTSVRKQAIQLGADPDKVVVIPNGVNTDEWYPISQDESKICLNLDPKGKIILYAGNLIERKGVDVLIRAFKHVERDKKVTLVIVGSGENERNFKKIAKDLDLNESIIFTGRVSCKSLKLWYNACDVFVLPSKSEGLSLSLLEAMACSRPVITTYPSCGKHDCIKEEKTGLLVSYGDAMELANTILRVLTNEVFAEQLGKNARKIVDEEFNWKKIAQKTKDLYYDTANAWKDQTS